MTSNIRYTLLNLLLIVALYACSSSEKTSGDGSNRLKDATSPYLIGHADNPVDWYEWGEEALEKARKENKPLIISIGYASCHWCHVMEEETFMDTAVARYMNEHFVSIKVDREERPDLDEIYLNAAQLINGEGGWPLNAFALPSGKPFYAGTYFTTKQWLGMLQNIHDAYQNDFEKIRQQSENLTAEIVKIQSGTQENLEGQVHQKDLLEGLKDSLIQGYDRQFGGVKGAPKFPMPLHWEFLLQQAYLDKDKQVASAVEHTLDQMAAAGIYDQLGGGFCRYATDRAWDVPHFEKMLYDNGMLVSLYAHAFQYSQMESYRQVLEETLRWVAREMTHAEGGFYSSKNADSEGEEGKFYVWDRKAIEEALTAEEYAVLSQYYDLQIPGKGEHGRIILAKKKAVKPGRLEGNTLVESAKTKLFNLRSKRIHPSTDDKILTSWNALMMKGYIDAYMAMGTRAYLDAALKNAEFIEKNMRTTGGGLYRNYRKGKAGHQGFLDDYAYLADAYLSLYQATFDIQWLHKAEALVEQLDAYFADDASPFYRFAPVQKTSLVESVPLADQVLPSPNAVVARVKHQLGELLYKENYILEAAEMMKAMIPRMQQGGSFYSSWAYLANMQYRGLHAVAIVGDDAPVLQGQLQRHYLPTAIFAGGATENLPLLESKYHKGQTVIYVCKNKICKRPTTEVSDALGILLFNNY
ncbi:hypothetical protein CLV98_105160 [Dyadobacter jejuensis]|uniref:Spermatogenesis-associated protein 20-like TRX domain-containing protein n=1 Tax=Dyadobacter jejuensis TaxID=1082580 RepID=A0A316AMF8_9BACT|nr:thioredoxin domain-containing protein [Dyadobacter jejuensis]PWJ57980.1 hypothetical protein CLV98_105160 [Dyadobacter jejuensis]